MRKFSALDAGGLAQLLPPGQPFTTYWVVVADEAEAIGLLGAFAVGEYAPVEIAHAANALAVYDGATLARYGISVEDVADPPEPIPHEVPMYKVKNELIDRDLLDDVEAFLASIPGKAGQKAQNAWTAAQFLVTDGELALNCKAFLQQSDEQYRDFLFAAQAQV